ncbi:uncharacterized protein LOC133336707 [Musca vetustissima]|uniref:uncharacterized protein LOC133336707 n=1 Tax=Musca vetustissima TaxID=27455 RepID=UPI002AB77966|nr:uncharacterized protein LOC133336707 [Musca vetustissima]
MGAFITTLLLLCGSICAAMGKHYELDILEVEWNTTTPDLIDARLKPVQPSRGIYGVSGYIDFKEDVNMDDTTAEVKVYYSSTGMNYQLSPFRVPEQSFTSGMNTAYKNYLMEGLAECCEDSPQAETFTSPLTKRKMICENCLFPSDNFPPTLRLGFYRLIILLYNDLDFTLSILLKVDLA